MKAMQVTNDGWGPKVSPLKAGFTLGQGGRSRKEVTPTLVKVDPEATLFDAVAAPGGGLVLVPPQKEGLLLRINSNSGYRRGCSGSSKLLQGDASVVVEGRFAFGEAGRTGSATDVLWEVRGLAIFWLSASRDGDVYVLANPHSKEVRLYDTQTMLQTLVAGEDPELTALMEARGEKAPENVRQALALAKQVAQVAQNPPVDTDPPQAMLYALGGREDQRPAQILEEVFGGRLKVLPGHRGGFSGEVLAGGYLAKGDQHLVLFHLSSGGGSRYALQINEVQGLTPIARLVKHRSGIHFHLSPHADFYQGWNLALVDPNHPGDFQLAYTQFKDGQVYYQGVLTPDGLVGQDGELEEEWAI